MQRVHITLVGGQPVPVYNGIIATNPDKVIFIYSNDTLNVVNNIRTVISVPEDEQQPLHVLNPQKILERIAELQKRYKEDEITVNISGGLKSWSHLFGREFEKMPNATVVYIDQNNVLWNYRTLEGSVCDSPIDITTHFRLLGNPIDNNYSNVTDYTDADAEVLSELEKLRVGGFIPEFNELFATTNKQYQHSLRTNKHDVFTTRLGSTVSWEKNKPNGDTTLSIVLKSHNKERSAELKSPHAIGLAFNSGWFEYKIARIFQKWDKAKKVFLNCHFPFSPSKDKNEVDIIVDTGKKVLFVECKTQLYDTTAIDKFQSVVRKYGGMGSKAIFITDALLSEMAIQKCKEYKMMYFSIAGHNGSFVMHNLFSLLESELFTINTK